MSFAGEEESIKTTSAAAAPPNEPFCDQSGAEAKHWAAAASIAAVAVKNIALPCLAIGVTLLSGLLCVRLMPLEVARRRELAELVADHIFSHINGKEFPAVVDVEV